MIPLLHFIRTIQPYATAVIFIALYLTEHLIPQRHELIDHRHDFINLLVGAGNLVVIFVCGYLMQWCLTWLYHRHFGLLYYLPLWAAIVSGLLLSDVFMYWWHRANHRISFLWYFHKFHHNDTKMNVSTAVRFHTGELFFSYILKLPFFALLGISPGVVVLYSLILLPVVALHHSNIRIGNITDSILRKFFVSPQMHRIHHSNNMKEHNSNYSSVLPVWDRLFKSYTPHEEKPVTFGI